MRSTNKTLKAAAFVAAGLLCHPSFAAGERIISAGSSVTELLFALGAENKVVAVDLTSRHYIGDRNIPQIGYHRQLSPEGLLALSPTHLVGSNDMGPDSTLGILKSSGVSVETIPDGDSLAEFNQRIDQLATLTDTQEKAREIKADVAEQMAILTANPPAHSPKVLFMMLSEGRPSNVAGKGTTVDTIIDLAGATNPAANKVTNYKPLSAEAIVNMQPDYILVAQRTWDSVQGRDAILKQHPLLAATPAGQAGRIIPIPGSAILGGFGLESLSLATALNKIFKQTN